MAPNMASAPGGCGFGAGEANRTGHHALLTRRRASARNSAAFVLAAYFGVTLLMTFPLALHWTGALPNGGPDVWQNYWNFWWWKHSLLEWRSLFWSPLLFHPFGVELRCHTHSAFNQILAMPVNIAFGEAAAYNFSVFFQRTLSAFGAWLLLRELTGNASAAFLGGLVFGFFPHMMEQSLEHLELTSTGFLPLVLYFLLRWRRSRRIRDALGFGACFGLNALCSWQLGILCSLVVAPALGLLGREAWRTNALRGYVRGVVAAAGVAVLLTAPVAPLDGFFGTGGCAKWATMGEGIDPTFLLTPPYANPIFGAMASEQYANRHHVSAGFVSYLGYVPLALAIVAVFASWRRARPWLALFAAALVLAVGSPLVWDGVARGENLLPFALVREMPVVSQLRVANRFMVLAGLALAVLVAYGVGTTLAALSPGWRRWALPVGVGLVLAEYSWLPYPLRSVEHPPLLAEIATRPGAVLDLPFLQRARTVGSQVAQTIHGRPIAGGYLSRPHYPAREFYFTEPALAGLAKTPRPDARVDVARLRELGFATLVIHKQHAESVRQEALRRIPRTNILAFRHANMLGGVPDGTIADIRRQLDAALGGAALEDEQLAIYFLDEPAAPNPPPAFHQAPGPPALLTR